MYYNNTREHSTGEPWPTFESANETCDFKVKCEENCSHTVNRLEIFKIR